jgi:hypothetical protein
MLKNAIKYAVLWTICMFLAYVVLNYLLSGLVWNGLEISQSALKVEYCEFNNSNSFFHQKMNTYSNLVYFFLGVFILYLGKYDSKASGHSTQNSLQKFSGLSVFTGSMLIYLCFGSSFFHASLSVLGQRVDMNGTYGLNIALIGLAVYHVFYKKEWSLTQKRTYLLTLSLILFAFIYLAPMVSSSILVPILLLLQMLLMLISYFQFPKRRFLSIGIFSFLLVIWAVKIRTADVQKINCDPYSLWQGHAVWHLLTGLSSFCYYAYYRFTKAI